MSYMNQIAPLAERMRPQKIEDIIGHQEIIGKGRPLYRLIKSDIIPSIIFFGPPGTGKTSLAQVIANSTDRIFEKLSAVTSGVKDIRDIIKKAENELMLNSKQTILFIDEIHRFNKSQQDALLPYVENGVITLIGATTENPFFEVNKALISRVQIFELHRLTSLDLYSLLEKALIDKENGLGNERIKMTKDAREALVSLASGDARVLLNSLEIAVRSSSEDINGDIYIDKETVENSIQKKVVSYDKGEEEHYNTISAFIKSVRGSDPDAAIYYLAKMLAGGEDPIFIARRLIVSASEDIGNADPLALTQAVSCFNACKNIGMPEARIILAQTTTYLASAPKSNASYIAIDKALEYIRENPGSEIPDHLKDAHYHGASIMGRGTEYIYPHNYPEGWVKQDYLPKEAKYQEFYSPKQIGVEKKIKERLDYFKRKKEST